MPFVDYTNQQSSLELYLARIKTASERIVGAGQNPLAFRHVPADDVSVGIDDLGWTTNLHDCPAVMRSFPNRSIGDCHLGACSVVREIWLYLSEPGLIERRGVGHRFYDSHAFHGYMPLELKGIGFRGGSIVRRLVDTAGNDGERGGRRHDLARIVAPCRRVTHRKNYEGQYDQFVHGRLFLLSIRFRSARRIAVG
jgi:hypothetical protein